VVDSSHPNHATLQSFVVAIYVSNKPQLLSHLKCICITRKLDALLGLYLISG
jgi:hypothetical protein